MRIAHIYNYKIYKTIKYIIIYIRLQFIRGQDRKITIMRMLYMMEIYTMTQNGNGIIHCIIYRYVFYFDN